MPKWLLRPRSVSLWQSKANVKPFAWTAKLLSFLWCEASRKYPYAAFCEYFIPWEKSELSLIHYDGNHNSAFNGNCLNRMVNAFWNSLTMVFSIQLRHIDGGRGRGSNIEKIRKYSSNFQGCSQIVMWSEHLHGTGILVLYVLLSKDITHLQFLILKWWEIWQIFPKVSSF